MVSTRFAVANSLVLALVACGASPPSVQSAPVQVPVAVAVTPVAASVPPAPPASPSGPNSQGPSNSLSAADAELRAAGVAHLDAGRFQDAERAFAAILSRNPGNAATTALYETARKLLADSQRSATRSLANVTPTRIGAAPMVHTVVRPVSALPLPAPRLVKRRELKNGITDDAAWFAKGQFKTPELKVPNPFMREGGDLPAGMPTRFGSLLLVSALDHGDHFVLIFGRDFSDGHVVAVLGSDLALRALFDFGAWQSVPNIQKGAESFVGESVNYAIVKDDVLYVQNGHRTYAASSGGKNAFLSALDVKTGELLWRSQPLVANASNFVLHGSHIFAGYGFTAEPDFMFVLERATGAVTSRVPVASGPSAVIEKDGALFVRTYDHDYVFAIEEGVKQAHRATAPLERR